jgi:glycosyltransferase involved in cell wall biosynthesis
MVDATIILLVKNGARYLEEILQAIFCQQTSFEFEVVAVDSGSRDTTLEILGRYPVRVINIPPDSFNHGETRNLGADQACETSRFLVYLTQDATPADPFGLAKLIAPMQEDERVAGVYSRHLPRPDSTPSMVRQMTTAWQSGGDQRITKEMPASLEEYEKNKFYYIFFSNTSSALRRSVWQQFRFPRSSFAEDAIWADTVLRAGFRLAYEPASRVIHSHDYNFTNQFRQNVDHAHGMVELFDPPHYRQKGFWFREFRAIPRHVWRDYIFMKNSTHFTGISFMKQMKYFGFSPFWHLASSLGTVIGARLHRMPAFLRLLFSRQERIRQGK